MVHAIETLLGQATRREELSRRQLDFARRHDWPRFVAQLNEIANASSGSDGAQRRTG
jgi:hypothetical protein